jgi:hypothetical protein
MIKKVLVFVSLVFLVIGVSMFVFVDRFPLAAAQAECRVEGSWVGSYFGGPWDDPLILQNTLTPLDPAGEKLTYVMRWVNPDVTLKNPDFTEVDYASELVGEAVKTGTKTYDFSLIGYGVRERVVDRNEITYIFVVNGSLTCEGDANITSDVTISVYSADQDADRDGFPDTGEDPITCIGPSDFGSAQRVPQMARCEPPPEEEEE